MADLQLADEWRSYSKTDYDIAFYDQGFRPLPIEIICYHCQQAAEKSFKAVLAYHEQEIPRIHDTFRLWQYALQHEAALTDLSGQAERLRTFSVITRYPNEIELNEDDMRQALKDARTIVEAIAGLWPETK